MNEKSLLGMLGLAERAGKLVRGQSRCVDGVRDGTLHLVVLDGGVSENTAKAVRNACRSHGAALIELDGAGGLGNAVGSPAVRVVGVKDEKFAQQLRSRYETGAEV